MKSGKTETGRSPCDCATEIRIRSRGDVNIYTCTPKGENGGSGGDGEPACCPTTPVAPGQCLPLALGAKPKQGQRQKLDAIEATSRVPSALVAGFFRHARRFLAGEAAANALESGAFGVFSAMTPATRGLLACATAGVDALPAGDRSRLLDPVGDGTAPLDAVELATAVGREIDRRARIVAFDDPDAPERPGRNRFFDVPPGEENFDIQLRICSVDDLRTVNFKPSLALGDYLPAELQQHCVPVTNNGQTTLSCSVQSGNCPGNALGDGACLRVPDVENGAAVVLKGYNYISVAARVRLEARPPLSLVREIDAYVFGDLDTPLTEIVNGQPTTIRDCRVHDQITFRVPDDLPEGVYGVQVVMPNVSGFPNLGNTLVSNQEFISVVPPAGARFTITSEELACVDETSPAFFGSDEVRVRVRAWPVTLSGDAFALGDVQAFDSPEFGDVDSDETRAMLATLFANQDPISGVVMMVAGFEIDSEKAYREQIDSFTDAFLHYLGIAVAAIGVGAAGLAVAIGIKELLLLGLAHPILLAIAAAVLVAVLVFVAAWAPADPIIADTISLTRLDLAALTNANLPLPAVTTGPTAGDITLTVSPVDKSPNQYHERREYASSGEDSRYRILLRYNRVG